MIAWPFMMHWPNAIPKLRLSIPPRWTACTAPGSLDTRLRLSGGPHDRLTPGRSGTARTTKTVLLDQPLGVVAGDEVADGIPDLVDGLVDAAVHDLLFQRAEEPFDDAIRLGLAHERVARGHAPEA